MGQRLLSFILQLLNMHATISAPKTILHVPFRCHSFLEYHYHRCEAWQYRTKFDYAFLLFISVPNRKVSSILELPVKTEIEWVQSIDSPKFIIFFFFVQNMNSFELQINLLHHWNSKRSHIENGIDRNVIFRRENVWQTNLSQFWEEARELSSNKNVSVCSECSKIHRSTILWSCECWVPIKLRRHLFSDRSRRRRRQKKKKFKSIIMLKVWTEFHPLTK